MKQKINQEYERVKPIIDDWICQYSEQCEGLGVSSHRVQISRFLDLVVLHLWTNKYDPYDVNCPFESYEDAEQFCIDEIKDRFGYIIDTFPIEILYFYGYVYAKQGCFLIDYIFDKDIDYEFNDTFERYTGKFNSKFENILINKLGVKRLIK